MDGLSSREYFLKTLDRPHYAGEGATPKAPGGPAPQYPKQQVRNETPVVAAQGQ
jgi:hypothetical protein